MTILLEAEHFKECGGWMVDSQFIDIMGSPYLMANGMGNPVNDAVTKINIPKSGKYRLWVRTKDWLPEYHPGTFQIIMNGKESNKTFGKKGMSGWLWEDGGVFDIIYECEIRLHDLTGYYSRCDVILLTDDLDFIPPTDTESIQILKAEYGGVSKEIKTMPKYDVIVIGGGLAGCTAAVAAARNCAKVALIQDRPMLGGNTSPEIMVPPVGVWNGRKESPFDPHETGLIEEYRTPGRQNVTEGKLYTKRLQRLVDLEEDLDLYLNTRAIAVEMKPNPVNEIEAIIALNVNNGQRMRFYSRIFIDCSGDSVISVASGAEYRQGKESKAMHNEPWGLDEPNTNTMGNGIKYYPVDSGKPQIFNPPNWIYKFPTCESFYKNRHPRNLAGGIMPDGKGIDHQWILELGGTRDTFKDAEEIRDDLFRLIYGVWDHLKNHCERNQDVAPNYKLGWVGYIAGKRENQRIIGDYILTQNEIIQRTQFDDTVAYGGWVNDDHYSEGFFHKGSAGFHEDHKDYACPGVEYSIPYRCLYSKNINNLMMAGRNISATHLALSNIRVMLTCALLGHAVGVGAAMCIKEKILPRGIYQNHIKSLQQQLMKEGAFIIGLKADDPNDLAPKASIKASSEKVWTTGEIMKANNVANGWSRTIGDLTNAWSPDENAQSPHWIELQWDNLIEFNVIHISFQKVTLSPKYFLIQIWQNNIWKTIAEVDNNQHRRHVIGLDILKTTKIRLLEDEPSGISEIRIYNEPEKVVKTTQKAYHNMRLPDVGPFLPWEDGFKQ